MCVDWDVKPLLTLTQIAARHRISFIDFISSIAIAQKKFKNYETGLFFDFPLFSINFYVHVVN